MTKHNLHQRLHAVLRRNHKIIVEQAMFTPGLPSYQGDPVFVITLDSKETECELYTNTKEGGLRFLLNGEELLRPWEFSLEKYIDFRQRRAAVEYVRRKLKKIKVELDLSYYPNSSPRASSLVDGRG